MSFVIVLLMLLIPAVLSVISARKLVLFILATGGIPLALMARDIRFLGVLGGGINAQALYLFVMILSVWVAFLPRFDELIRELLSYKAFLGFLIFCVVSLVWTTDIVYGFRMLAKLLSPFLFYAAVKAFLRSKSDLKSAEKMIFASCLIVLFLALLNNLSGGWLAPDRENMEWVRRNVLTVPYMSPANFSFLLSCGALLALGNFMASRKPGFLILYGVFAGATFWAFTRISMVGLVVATSIYIFLMTRSLWVKVTLPLILVSILVVAIFAIPALRARMFMDSNITLSAVVDNPEKAQSLVYMSGRKKLWQDAKKNFVEQNPLIGRGVGSVDFWLDHRNPPSRLHSDYLRIVADVGFIGLGLYIAAMVHFLKRLMALRRTTKNKDVKKYATVAISALAFYAITLSTDNSLNYVTEFGLYVFSFIGLALLSAKLDAKTTTIPWPMSQKREGTFSVRKFPADCKA